MIDRLRTIYITRKKRYLYLLSRDRIEPKTFFVILCQPRTGSTLLHTYLNSHSEIYSYGEMLRRTIAENKHHSKKSIYELAFKPHQKSIKAVGLKLFYAFHEKPIYQDYFQEIVANTAIKIIHLERNNLLDAFVSLKKAEWSNSWSSTNATLKNNQQKQLSTEEFKTYLNQTMIQKRQMETLFKKHQQYSINYEDLTQDPKNALLEIQNFLGVNYSQVFSLLKKQGHREHIDINNNEELKKIYNDYNLN